MTRIGTGDDAQLILARDIDFAAEELGRVAAHCHVAPRAALHAPEDPNAPFLDEQVRSVEAAAESLQSSLEWFASATRLAGSGYRAAERATQEVFSQFVQSAMHALGLFARPAVLAGIAGVVGGSILLPALDRLTQNSVVRAGLELLLAPVAAQLNVIIDSLTKTYGPLLEVVLMHPRTLDLLGYGARGVDDFLLGLVGAPRGTMSDNEAITMLAAGLLPLIANGHRLGSSPVSVREASDAESRLDSDVPVSSYSDGFDQITTQDSDIVIRSYELPDGTLHHQVFSQGTQNWTLGEEESGFDLLSNIENAASHGELFGSAYGVLQAMEAAGIGPDDTVDLFGYSQGGAAVALVAASQTFNVVSMTTYAAPSGQIEVPVDVDWVQIQIDGDAVPHVAGMSQHRTNARVLEVSVDIEVDSPFGYHLAPAYRAALADIEASGDSVALAQAQVRAERLDGARLVESAAYELDR